MSLAHPAIRRHGHSVLHPFRAPDPAERPVRRHRSWPHAGASLGIRRAAIMPFAEAMGISWAVSFFIGLTDGIQGERNRIRHDEVCWRRAGCCIPAVRLLGHAIPERCEVGRQLFVRRIADHHSKPEGPCLVGTVLIAVRCQHPGLPFGWRPTLPCRPLAGPCLVVFGGCLPLRVRRHSYKLASLILGAFSLAAVAKRGVRLVTRLHGAGSPTHQRRQRAVCL